jgi:hypothetical protein
VNPFIAITDPDFGNFINPKAQGNLLIPDGLIAIGGAADLDYLAGPPLADPIMINQFYHQGALISRL